VDLATLDTLITAGIAPCSGGRLCPSRDGQLSGVRQPGIDKGGVVAARMTVSLSTTSKALQT